MKQPQLVNWFATNPSNRRVFLLLCALSLHPHAWASIWKFPHNELLELDDTVDDDPDSPLVDVPSHQELLDSIREDPPASFLAVLHDLTGPTHSVCTACQGTGRHAEAHPYWGKPVCAACGGYGARPDARPFAGHTLCNTKHRDRRRRCPQCDSIRFSNNRTVRNLADHIYQQRDFYSLPILADALEEAGCTHPAILRHCRYERYCCCRCHPYYELLAGEQPHQHNDRCAKCNNSGDYRATHARGCWVLDLILGKK